MRILPLFPALLVLISGAAAASPAGPKWHGTVPELAKDQLAWSALLESLKQGKFQFGAMAAAQRMLTLFTDLPTKEEAYRTVIELMDAGYPFSSLATFLPGDIEPDPPSERGDRSYGFYNNYYLYKAFVNQEKNAKRWADNYLAKVDRENFAKLAFSDAIQAYGAGKMDEAEEKLRKLLARDYDASSAPFVKKIARTLARIYFEREQFEKALDIYVNFLLKLNPVTPSDWLETAWSLYHLKRYPEAVGVLYNLESRSAGKQINPEKYIIRALSYRALCDVPSSEGLIQAFDSDFGKTIRGIKQGEPLSSFPELRQLDIASNTQFSQASTILAELEQESSRLAALPSEQQPLAKHVYTSVLGTQRRKQRMLLDPALERAAEALIMVEEQLRFMKFDIARERFNPDAVFMPSSIGNTPLVKDGAGDTYILRWRQLGDFWRDERLIYLGALQNRCAQ